MTISYNWLKNYLPTDLHVERVAEILTDTGLEVEGIEEIESIKGGLKGVVVGEVLTCEKHPNADRLSVTTVNLGDAEPVQIVCGAPNVAANQKVLVATVGTTLYSQGEPFKIKKGKIRGEVSNGMICAEDELGLGKSHDGILVLPADAKVGMPASQHFNIESDFAIEIGLTPNRTDAMGHLGVARDLRAALNLNGENTQLKWPNAEITEGTKAGISIEVENTADCPQYFGITLENVVVAPSPEWLQNSLKTIGLKPQNNVVDVTNFVLHELGHPLHAFDADKITGGKVVVKNVPENTPFVTLDGVERKLSDKDLVIANSQEPMCIAGVLGGEKSGVSEQTKTVFLESAYFNPVSVRKTAKRHGLNTDASYRYERGVDPNMSLFALKRAASLLVEIAEATIASSIQKVATKTFDRTEIALDLNYVNQLIGNEISVETVAQILALLDIEILNNQGDTWQLAIPTYRVDVTRPADVVEEILRIYGFNNVALPGRMHISVNTKSTIEPSEVRHEIAALLAANGYSEIMNNSLTKADYYKTLAPNSESHWVKILNPLSQDLGIMRQNLLFGGLEVVQYNLNRQRQNMRMFEFGNTYFKNQTGKFTEEEVLMTMLTGKEGKETWTVKPSESTFFQLKGIVQLILDKLGIKGCQEVVVQQNGFTEALQIKRGSVIFAELGQIAPKWLAHFGVSQTVYAANINWKAALKAASKAKIVFKDLPKFPAVKRDLALLVNADVAFEKMKTVAQKAGGKLVKEIGLFDVYTGKNLPENKKSYAMNFVLQDENQTLVDKKTDAVMSKILAALKKEFDADLR